MRFGSAARLAIAGLATVTACGTSQRGPESSPAPSVPSPTGANSPAPAPTMLAFLVPEGGGSQSATVEWVTPGGEVKAKAGFAMARLSPWTNAGPLLQPPARLAAGMIFYVDSGGVIRTLGQSGATATATTLLLRPGQNIVSFAVSPDGQRIAASILNYPPRHDPPPNGLNDPFLEPGDWWYDDEVASVGGAANRVISRDLGRFANLDQPGHITTVVGWDAGGPVAIADTQLAAQYPPFSDLTPGGALVHLGPDGSRLDQLGGAGCIPLDANAAGNVVCYTSASPKTPEGCVSQYTVNSPGGATLWSANWSGCVYNPRLSPASDRFCTDSGAVYSAHAAPIRVPQTDRTQPETCKGWVDDSTVVLWGSNGNEHQVYTWTLASHTRTTIMTAFGIVQYLGSTAGR